MREGRCRRLRLSLLGVAGAISLACTHVQGQRPSGAVPAFAAPSPPSAPASLCAGARGAARSGLRGPGPARCQRVAPGRAEPALLALHMGRRRRRGAGDQRSRWSTRIASEDPDAPQPEGEEVVLGTGENRMAKIEALASRRQAGLVVVLEDPADAMNAGAVLRSCDAFGVSALPRPRRTRCCSCDSCLRLVHARAHGFLAQVTEIWFIHNGIKEGTSMRPHIESGRAFDPDSNNLQIASASASRWVATRTWYSTQVWPPRSLIPPPALLHPSRPSPTHAHFARQTSLRNRGWARLERDPKAALAQEAIDELAQGGYTSVATCFTDRRCLQPPHTP